MKLIDLLVQELPKRGGWPDGAESVVQDADDSEFYFFTGGPMKNSGKSWWFVDSDNRNDNSKWIFFEGKNDIADDCNSAIVTRAQYESALADSQKPAWNCEGLPPVGMHCEIVDPDGVLMYGQGESGEVIAHVENTAVIRMSYGLGCFEARFLRPARSEAKRKRDAAIEAINVLWNINSKMHCESIYDAIAAGKIPGVKLDD